jgi:ABC-2 type transport system ATP-binding protein
VIAEGTSGELKASVGSGTLHVGLRDPADRERAGAFLKDRLGVEPHFEDEASSLSLQISDTARAARTMADMSDAGIGVAGFSLGQPSLDEVFFALTGHGAEGQAAEEKPAEKKK